MRIRARLTLWYAGVLLASVLLMAGGMYYELVVERRAAKAEHRRKDPMEDEVLEIVLIYCAPSLLVAVVGGWWLMRKALAPLDGLTRAAEQIHMHNLRERLPRSHTGDEVDRLAAVLNDMTQRLEGSFAQISE
ncbi:MAG: HAMP domain-containing protein, partial [Verrucomicrobia bacterium]|nr:HAMP domain-containing protein [Verrucomicrobiota bacterium]